MAIVVNKKEEILSRHINRLHRLYPKDCDDYTTLSYNCPEVILEVLNAMEEYANYCTLHKNKPIITK